MTGWVIPKELIAFVIQDFPESIIMTLVVFSFLGLRFAWRKIILIAFLQALVNLIRLLPFAAGVHSVVLVISLAVLVSAFTASRLSRVFIAVLICSIIVFSLELIYARPLLSLTGLSYEAAFANPFLRALFSLPYEIVLLVLAFGKNYYNQRKGKFTM